MTSGVYLLTFPSGKRYIGKSINIPERWEQHRSKLIKGTAAKPMQEQWNRHGEFEGSILAECHSDHIDVVEACYIARWKPELNTAIPADPYADKTAEEVDQLFTVFKYPSSTIVEVAIARTNEINDLKKKVAFLEIRRSDEDIAFDVQCEIDGLQEQLDATNIKLAQAQERNESLTRELALAKRSWWQKLFG